MYHAIQFHAYYASQIQMKYEWSCAVMLPISHLSRIDRVAASFDFTTFQNPKPSKQTDTSTAAIS